MYDGGTRLWVPMTGFGPGMAGLVALVRGGFAVGVEWVYCFLSRREGDSEELVTAGGQTPKFKTKFW